MSRALVLTLALGCVLVLAMAGVFFPWAFYLGGSFHLTPYWRGWGKLHAKSGDYLLWVCIRPTTRGSRMYLETNLTVSASVCTPRGESIPLRLNGDMPKHLNLSTDGEAIHLSMSHVP